MPITIGQRPDHGFDQPLALLSDCHRRIEHFLHVLVAITEQAAGAPLAEAQRSELAGAVTYFASAAPRHTADEEESLFPRLKASRTPAAAAARELLARLEHDHTDANGHHAAVDALVRRWLTEGTLAAHDVAELRGRLAALSAIYAAHIASEDGELFPAAARALSAEDLAEIGREMAARRRRPASEPGTGER